MDSSGVTMLTIRFGYSSINLWLHWLEGCFQIWDLSSSPDTQLIQMSLQISLSASPEEKDSSGSTSSTSIEMPSFSPITSSESISDTSSCCSVSEATPQFATTFKIVGDNIDKTIRPRQETSQHHTQSLHYFHSFAVKDRCDVSGLEDQINQILRKYCCTNGESCM